MALIIFNAINFFYHLVLIAVAVVNIKNKKQ